MHGTGTTEYPGSITTSNNAEDEDTAEDVKPGGD